MIQTCSLTYWAGRHFSKYSVGSSISLKIALFGREGLLRQQYKIAYRQAILLVLEASLVR